MADRSVKVTLRGDVSDFNRAMLGAAASSKGLSKTLDTTDHRMNSLVQTSLALGPALVPISAAAVPAISGLANQLGFAAVGAGTAMVAFQGVGDALSAVNDYAIDPTNANLKNLRETMASLGPAGREFTLFLQELRPQMQELQNVAQAGLFPGLEAGITDLMTRLPQVQRIIDVVATSMGDIAAEAGAELAGPGWDEFFTFLEREARPTLISMAASMGNFARGFAELWMAFDPLSDQFSAGFLQMSRDFATWADGLSQTQGFQEFIAYIQDVLPQVGATFGAFGNMLLQLLQAAAPVGAAALAVLEPIFDVIAGIANTPIGTTLIALAAGLAAVGRARAIFNAANLSPLMTLARTDFRTPAQGLTTLGSRVPILRSLTEASRNLQVAQQQLAVSGARAQQAQFALIPQPQKVAALRDFGKAQSEVARTSAAMAAAQKRAALQIGGGAALVGGLAFAMSDLDDKMHLTNTTTGAMVGLIGGPWGAALGAGIGLAIDFASAQDDIGAAVAKSDEIIANSSLSIQQKMAGVNATLRTLQAERRAILAEGDQVGPKGRVTEANTGAVDTAIAGELEKKKALIKADQDLAFAEFGLTGAMAGTTAATRAQTYALIENATKAQEAASAKSAAIGGEVAYEAAVDATTAAIKQYGENTNLSTEGGRALATALRSQIDSWNALTPAAQAARGGLDKARDGMYEAARAAGYSKKEARAMADEMVDLSQIDVNVPIDVETATGSAKTAAIRRALNDVGNLKPKPSVSVNDKATPRLLDIRGLIKSLRDKTVTITTKYQTTGAPNRQKHRGKTVADGGVLDGYANHTFAAGGFENHTAQIARAGIPYRVWAEPETGGEAYIPLAMSKRERSLDIWAEVGKRLGVQGFADGFMGATGPLPAAPGPIAATLDERIIARAVTQGVQNATWTANLDRDGRTLQLTMKRG